VRLRCRSHCRGSRRSSRGVVPVRGVEPRRQQKGGKVRRSGTGTSSSKRRRKGGGSSSTAAGGGGSHSRRAVKFSGDPLAPADHPQTAAAAAAAGLPAPSVHASRAGGPSSRGPLSRGLGGSLTAATLQRPGRRAGAARRSWAPRPSLHRSLVSLAPPAGAALDAGGRRVGPGSRQPRRHGVPAGCHRDAARAVPAAGAPAPRAAAVHRQCARAWPTQRTSGSRAAHRCLSDLLRDVRAQTGPLQSCMMQVLSLLRAHAAVTLPRAGRGGPRIRTEPLGTPGEGPTHDAAPRAGAPPAGGRSGGGAAQRRRRRLLLLLLLLLQWRRV